MLTVINSIILIVALLLASIFDIKLKKIPNFLTFTLILWGLLSTTISKGFKGFQFSILGFLFGIAIFFIPFAFNLIGAGDTKLMGAVGAIMGWKFSLSAVLYSGLAGGILAVIIIIFNKSFFNVLLKIFGIIINPILKFLYLKTGKDTFLRKIQYIESKNIDKKKKYLPYGVAIAAGTILVLSGIVPKVIE
jgi:prepilin peptidase CpaA